MHRAIKDRSTARVRSLLETDPTVAIKTDSEGKNTLHLATVEGDVELIKLILPHVDVNAVDNVNRTAVHWATVSGFSECVAFLIENGCNPATQDIHGAYPIHYATQMSHDQDPMARLRCLRILLQKGGSSLNCVDTGGKTPLMWAASSGNIQACRLLVELKADVAHKDVNGLTALHSATCRNHAACVEMLIKDCKLDTNSTDKIGCTPLFYAIMMNHPECSRMLLKCGASPNWQDHNGRSPAFCAAMKGSVPFLKLLKDFKASLHLRTTTKDTPLSHAIDAGHTDAASFLLERGCRVSTRDGSGRTALHLAASKNNLSLCKLLVKHKANINAVYKQQEVPRTPLDCAEEKGHSECKAYLLSLGAKRAADIPEDSWQCEEEEEDEEKGEEEEEEVEEEIPADSKDERKEDAPRDDTEKISAKKEREKVELPQGKKSDNKNKSKLEPSSSQRFILTPEFSGTKEDTEELERKLKNWNAYLKENVEFLDVIINSRAPELSEARARARRQRKELLGRLEELRSDLERSCRGLVKDVEKKEERREKRYKEDRAALRSLHAIEEKFQRANASAAASLDEYQAARPTPLPIRRNSQDDDESDGDDHWYSSQRHNARLQVKNIKMRGINPAPPSKEGSNGRGIVVIQGRRDNLNRIVPDHRTVMSPHNAKVILPLRLQEPRPPRQPQEPWSNQGQLASNRQAETRRWMGQINTGHSKTKGQRDK